MKKKHFLIAAGLIMAAFAAQAVTGIQIFTPEQLAGLSLLGCIGNIELIGKQIDAIEKSLAAFSSKADEEIKATGKVASDTKAALEGLGAQQREIADRLLVLEQRGTQQQENETKTEGWGQQFIKSDSYKAFLGGVAQKASLEVKNTVVTSDTVTAPDRKPGVVGGAFRMFTIEDLLNSAPTSSNAIEYTRENVFTNAAAETAEGGALPESSITFTLDNVPVQSIGHWIKLSRQLISDSAALAAYINTRLRYGVNLRVENQLVNGNGTSPNLSGLFKSGNYTAHGYTAAALTALGLSATNRFDLIGKMLGDCQLADYPADGILLNPADWWTLRLTKDTTGRYLLGDPGDNVMPMLFNTPVVACSAVTADQVMVGSFGMAATKHDREGVTVDLSESDSDNFTKQLVTVRATRRLALAVERPASLRAGDLTPA